MSKNICHCERSEAIQDFVFLSSLLRYARKDGPTGQWSASVDEIQDFDSKDSPWELIRFPFQLFRLDFVQYLFHLIKTLRFQN